MKFGATEGLRTLDALQLAIALDLKQLGQVSLMVTADQRLSRAAPLAGCPAATATNPIPPLTTSYPEPRKEGIYKARVPLLPSLDEL